MKKRLIALILIGLLAVSASGCRSKIRTELATTGIKSMISNEYGDIFLLDDSGLRCYNLSTDKSVETIHTSSDFSNARFEWIYNGIEITYSGLYVEQLMAADKDGVIMVGRYLTNSLGRDSEMFVFQDAADLGIGAGYFTEVEKPDGNIVNGVSADDGGELFKLTANGVRGHDYTTGSRLTGSGQVKAYPMPDGVTGSIYIVSDQKTLMLVETDDVVELTDGETAVKTYERKNVADAFVKGDSVYVIYKDGRVTETSTDGKEKDFMKLADKVSEVHDALLYDGELYWFDDEGIKTSAK
ncbi:MAG: hypothetical protein J1F63_04015 [Oscillospiraceae bacterium]|nr:hypothetical protein [Oscillospiraceae bacterium]